MKYRNGILNSFCHALIPVLSSPFLEMDYFTSCCYLFYICFHTVGIVRNSLPIFRSPIFRFPKDNFSIRRTSQIVSAIKLSKKMTETSRTDCGDHPQDCSEIINSKRPGESLPKYSCKKLKLFSKDDQKAVTISEQNFNTLGTDLSGTAVSTKDSPKTKRKKKKKKTKMDARDVTSEQKQIPNYFLAVSISDPQICSSVERIQKSLISQDDRLKEIMLPLNDLHVTMMVMYLNDDEAYNRAIKALNNAYEDVKHEMCENPLNLEFRGLGHFGRRVIYAKLSPNESYTPFMNLAKCLKSYLSEENIWSTDKKDEFTPHLTIGKVRFCRKNCKAIKVNPDLYDTFKDQYFGNQIITGFMLFKMTGERDPVTGCRIGDEFLFQKEK